jgi:leucyl-tRNA synthetase
MVLAEDGKKMSKSLGNVINPDEMVAKFGSDAVRLYEMFMGPWDQAISWDTRSLVGQKRFLERVIDATKRAGEITSPKLSIELSKLGEKVERGIIEQKFNTAIAAHMEFVNLWRNGDLVMSQEDINKFAQLLSPFAPICAKSIWDNAETSKWPTFEEVSLVSSVPVIIAVQVNGKLRATVEIESGKAKTQDEVMKVVMENEQVKKWAATEPSKIVFIPGRLVNIVL